MYFLDIVSYMNRFPLTDWAAKNQRLDFVESQPSPKRKKETARRAGAGDVEASAPNDRKRQRKHYQDAARDERT
jgi:hypothetical protein